MKVRRGLQRLQPDLSRLLQRLQERGDARLTKAIRVFGHAFHFKRARQDVALVAVELHLGRHGTGSGLGDMSTDVGQHSGAFSAQTRELRYRALDAGLDYQLALADVERAIGAVIK